MTKTTINDTGCRWKIVGWVYVLLLPLSSMLHAAPVTYFHADFDDISVSSYGWGYAAQITETNLNAGTAVGSWTVHSSQVMADNSRKKQILADGGTNGPNKALRFGTSLEGSVGPDIPILSANLSDTLPLGNTITFSFGVVCHDAEINGRAIYVTGLDGSDNRVFQLHIEVIASPTGGQLGYVDQSGSQVMLGEAGDLIGYSKETGGIYIPGDMRTVTVTIDKNAYGIDLAGASWSTNGIAFRDAAASGLARVDFSVENQLWTAAQFDDFVVAQLPPAGTVIIIR